MCEPWVDTGGRGRGRDSKRAWRERTERAVCPEICDGSDGPHRPRSHRSQGQDIDKRNPRVGLGASIATPGVQLSGRSQAGT